MSPKSSNKTKYLRRMTDAKRMDTAKQELTELLLEDQEGHVPTKAPNTSTPADQARKEKLMRESIEFEPGSDFKIIIYSKIPDCDMENPCKMAGGLLAKMIQASWGHVEKPAVYPGWHFMKITYDLRALDEHDTDMRRISLGLWRCFLEAHMWCLKDQPNDWEDFRTISKKVDGEVMIVVKVEEWSNTTA